MRCNKQELAALASQTSQNFDREGVMVLKEKQDGFFRRSEGSSERWFRLRGNLLFYLKGPEPWQEPLGVIVLGHHQIKVQDQDENGHWPFHIVWENGVCYRMATVNEAERTLWLKAIQKAPYDVISSQLVELTEKLNKIRTVIDIATYRLQKGIVLDLNELPLCEVALSCDNLLCDAYGRPPSPFIVLYIDYSTGLCVKYGNTEVVETCSNPSFSKTILFRSSDGLTGETMVRIVVYDVKESVSETSVTMGFTSLQLSTIQEAQRLRVALMTYDNKNIGFVTINGWSLEPSYITTSPSPSHTYKLPYFDIPHRYACHRRSHSLPPRLGLKLKFPMYGNLIKHNFVNSHQVTYRFHSGLGGDITVHEVMSESKLCYQIPMQLLDIYIQREKELIDELLSVVGISGQWLNKQLELAGTHMSLLKYYCHSKRCLHQAENAYFKPSCKKDDSSLAFAPINMHLQRMWACNETVNKLGFHDIITVGAFSSHAPNSEATGGLIRLVQQVKDISSTKAALNYAAANKIQSEYDNVMTLIRLRDEIVSSMERIVVLLQANQKTEAIVETDGIKNKEKSMLALFEPSLIEESLAIIGWPKRNCDEDSENQAMSTLMRLTEQLSTFDSSDCDTFETSTSTSSSKETSPTFDSVYASSSSSKDIKNELQFYNDYFNSEERSRLNHSFRSVRSPTKPKLSDSQSLSFDSKRHGSLRHDFKSTASLEQVSYKCLMESLSGIDKKKNLEFKSESPLPSIGQIDSITRENNLALLKSIETDVHASMMLAVETVIKLAEPNQDITEEELESLKKLTEEFKLKTECLVRWIRLSHVAVRLRYESPSWSKENTALQTRRDICFSQALTALTSGLFCWFWSTPSDVIYKLLVYDMGPLCEFEGLLSLYSLEKAIWGDMVVAVEDLQTVVFTLTKAGQSNTASPHISGTRGALTVYIPVSDALYDRFTEKEASMTKEESLDLSFTITAVFFNIGVNKKATLADALGESIPQYHSNNDNFDRLYKYYHKYNKIFPIDPTEFHRVSLRAKPLGEVVDSLRIAVRKRLPKNIEVLQLAALATKIMNGVRFTSCKSAKDRTGMSVTLEQCSVLASEFELAEHEVKPALNVMRSEGCRRENTFKNIGVRKYAFTHKQVLGLPLEYRPPPGTYGATQT